MNPTIAIPEIPTAPVDIADLNTIYTTNMATQSLIILLLMLMLLQ